jgi:hypothetical protein
MLKCGIRIWVKVNPDPHPCIKFKKLNNKKLVKESRKSIIANLRKVAE